MQSVTTTLTQAVYDTFLRKRDSYDELYRGWYADYLQQLEKYGRKGIEGGGADNSIDDEEGPWAEKIYVDLHRLFDGILDGMLDSATPRRLLDIGAGSGNLSCRMAGPDLQAHLIDKEPLAVQVARRVAALMDKEAHVQVECADIFEFAADQPYDVVVSLGLFEELDAQHRDRYLHLARELTRPGGAFLVGVPNFASPVMVKLWRQHGKGNEVFISRTRLRRLLRGAGFTDVRACAAGSVIPRRGGYWADHHLARWLGMMNIAWGRRP